MPHPAVASSAPPFHDFALDTQEPPPRSRGGDDCQTLKAIRTDLIALCRYESQPGDAIPIPILNEETTRRYPAESFAHQMLSTPAGLTVTGKIALRPPMKWRRLFVIGVWLLAFGAAAALGSRGVSRALGRKTTLAAGQQGPGPSCASAFAPVMSDPLLSTDSQSSPSLAAIERPQSQAVTTKPVVTVGSRVRVSRPASARPQPLPGVTPARPLRSSPPADNRLLQILDAEAAELPMNRVELVD
jgi:hypothetical protein